MGNARSEWTDWAEAISWVSATLGDTFSRSRDNGLYWDTFVIEGSDMESVGLERIGSEVKVIVDFNFINGNHAAKVKLLAIVGWASDRKHMIEVSSEQ